MCQQMREFRDATVSFAAGFDPALLSCQDARAVVANATVIENTWSTIKTLAAARVADCGDRRPHAQRVAAEELARTTGTTVGAARNIIETGRKLQHQPEVGAAARRGELSPPQTTAIADAAAADPRAERRLLEIAASGSLSELRDACAHTQAAAQPDPDERHDEIRAGRRLNTWTDAGGVGHLHAAGPVEDIAQIVAALRPITEQIFQDARRDGPRESPYAYAFDALVALATDASSEDATDPDPADTGTDDTGTDDTGADTDASETTSATGAVTPGTTRRRKRRRRGAPVKILVRVDLDTWLRGVPLGDEVCELVGHGPIPVSVLNRLLDQGDPFVVAVLTKAKAVVGVAHLGRRPTAHQQSALEWLYPTCAVRGCHAHADLEVDHRIDWAKTHFTMVDWLDRLCRIHHLMKTREGWGLVEGDGKRDFVPPDDPRHPGNTSAAA